MTRTPKLAKRNRKTVKLRTNGKHKIDAASTISAPVGLTRMLRPQALFRWLGPQLAAITPTYIEQTMLGAMAGSSLQAWSLFDLMLKTWPELLACYQELIESVIRKKLVYEPYCEEDEKPSDSALERMKVVATALRRMEPDPARDDSNIEGTIRDILDAWFRGVAVSEIIWQTVEDKQVGTITAPKSTFAVDPTNYAYATDGSLGLRTDKSRDTGVWPYSSTTLNPQPSQLTPFSRYENKFLIAMHKASGGSPLGGALLRPLAWWWCAANFSSDWLLNLAQVFGLPFRWASYDPNASTETLATIDNMLQNMGSNGWARFPTPTTIEFVDMGKQGSDHSPQGELLDRADRYARSLILGQTMTGTHGTTGKGGGQAFGTVEQDVKADRIDAAGKFAVTVINQQLVPSILMLNFGNTDEMPTLKFLEDEVADLTEAQRDKTLADAGLEIGVDYLRKKYDIPEPADGEDTIGGEKPMPDFGQFGGSLGQDTGDNAQNEPSTDEPPTDEPAKASDQTGHPFRGNQYVTLGTYVNTPHGFGVVVAQDQQHAWVSVNGTIRKVKHSDMTKIPHDKSSFPGIAQSDEDKRRQALQTKLELIQEIKDDKIFARELAVLAGVEIAEPIKGVEHHYHPSFNVAIGETPPPVVNVAAPIVSVEAAKFDIHVPETKVTPAPIHVDAPNVTIKAANQEPPKVTVNVSPTPVKIDNQVNVDVPAVQEMEVIRDKGGKISGIEVRKTDSE